MRGVVVVGGGRVDCGLRNLVRLWMGEQKGRKKKEYARGLQRVICKLARL